MPDLLTLPEGAPIQGADEVMIVRGGETYAVTVTQLLAGLQAALSLAQGTVLGRSASGTGTPVAVALGNGLALSGGAIVANAADHLGLTALDAMDVNAHLVVNSAGAPARLPWPLVQTFMKNQLAWLDGTGAPSGALGVNDDYYINNTNTDYYRKVNGAWVFKGNFRGVIGQLAIGTGLTSAEGSLNADVRSVAGRTGAVTLSTPDVAGLGNAATRYVGNSAGTVAAGDDTRIVNAVQAGVLGQAGGVATLGGDGKVPMAQMPPALVTGFTPKGKWNASTNTPSLASGVGSSGDVWTVAVAGSTQLDSALGEGETWGVGDQAQFAGGKWERYPFSDTLGTMAAQDADDVAVTKINIGPTVSKKFSVLTAPEVDKLGRLVSFVRRSGRRVIAEASIRVLRVGTMIGPIAPTTMTMVNTVWSAAAGKFRRASSVTLDANGQSFEMLRRDGTRVFAAAKIKRLTLGGDPASAMAAATKQYVDAAITGASPAVGMQLLLEPSVDFDAPTDGTTDASTQVNACVAAAIAAGSRQVWIQRQYATPTLDSICGDVIFVGPGSLTGHTLPKVVIPAGAPAPPTPPRTFVLSRDCPTLAAAIADTNAGVIVQIGDSITTPDGAVAFPYLDSLSGQIARAFTASNPGVNLTVINRGAGGQTFASWATVHSGVGEVPEWLTDTEAPMLSYIEALHPHCLTIALGINDNSSIKYSDIKAIVDETQTWVPAPDLVFVTGFGNAFSDTESLATSQRRGALFAQAAVRSYAKAHGHGLLDTAMEDDLSRFGFCQETLPLLQDPAMVGGTLLGSAYTVSLPWTMPVDVYGWGATFVIPGAGNGWGALGNHLTFQIGADLNANMKGCFFEIRRNVDYSVDWRITTTLTAEGADVDAIFRDWTPIAGLTSQLNASLRIILQKRGSILYASLGGGTAGTPTTNNDTIVMFNGPVPSGGGWYRPIIRCGAGTVAGVLQIQGGATYYSEAFTQRPENSPRQLCMPDTLDREFSSDVLSPPRPWGGSGVHPGSLTLRRAVTRVIDANDFQG